LVSVISDSESRAGANTVDHLIQVGGNACVQVQVQVQVHTIYQPTPWAHIVEIPVVIAFRRDCIQNSAQVSAKCGNIIRYPIGNQR
jgi:hypothetical protein